MVVPGDCSRAVAGYTVLLGAPSTLNPSLALRRAISPEHAGEAITLKDIQAARAAHRRALRSQVNERLAAVSEYLPPHPGGPSALPQGPEPPAPSRPRPRLHTYLEDKA